MDGRPDRRLRVRNGVPQQRDRRWRPDGLGACRGRPTFGARAVMAQHMPRYGPDRAATQVWIQGPAGEPPLIYERTLAVHATDGRWIWEERGTVQPWERPDRYVARRKRVRLDRLLLVDYLAAMEIFVDDPAFFGAGQIIRADVPWKHRIRQQAAAEFRAEHGWGQD